jgi:transposase
MTLYVRNREELEHLIITLRDEGWSIRGLGRRLQMGRNTLRRILRKKDSDRNEGHDLLVQRGRPAPRRSKLDSFLPAIQKLLEEFPALTGQRLYEELKIKGYEGGISILRDRLRKLRPKPKRDPVMRFETGPGLQGQMDWSPYTLPFARSGKAEILCFSYILGFSRRQYIDFTTDRKFFTLIRRHQDAFRHFEGVPKQCLYDGEKTVLLRWEASRPVYNPAFIAFITHYRCQPIAVRRPETKGKIEAPFLYIEKNLLNGRHFQDLDDLRATAHWWLREKSDPHVHETTRRPPLELFMEQERSALQPLPLHDYDSSEVALRVCSIDGFLDFETNRYSVPYEYVADILTLKATEQEVFIYNPEIELVAQHERLPQGVGKTVEKPEHRGSKKIRYGLEPVREAFLALGDATSAFLAGLQKTYPRNCGFHARSILHLKTTYHADDIHRALHHALRYQAFDAKAIERILLAQAKPRTLESVRNEQARKELEKTLPRIEQRPLDEYCRLLSNEEKEDDQSPEHTGPDSGPDPSVPQNIATPQDGESPR